MQRQSVRHAKPPLTAEPWTLAPSSGGTRERAHCSVLEYDAQIVAVGDGGSLKGAFDGSKDHVRCADRAILESSDALCLSRSVRT
jgi:hypothetical protein